MNEEGKKEKGQGCSRKKKMKKEKEVPQGSSEGTNCEAQQVMNRI